MNNISFISIPLLLLYEHRYLFSDNCQYNSLLLSSLIQKDIELIGIKFYTDLQLSDKIAFHEKYEIITIYFFNNGGVIKYDYIHNFHKFNEPNIIDVYYGWDKKYFQYYDDKNNLMIKEQQ